MDKPRYPAVRFATFILMIFAFLLIVISCLAIVMGVVSFLRDYSTRDQLIGLYVCGGGILGISYGLGILVFCDLALAIVNTANQTAELLELARRQKPVSIVLLYPGLQLV